MKVFGTIFAERIEGAAAWFECGMAFHAICKS